MSAEIVNVQQLEPAWFELRKNKITATDASTIIGVNPWKTRLQLYHEKLSDDPPSEPNDRMKRGIDLEPVARNLFTLKTGIVVEPKVVVKDWAMASLDGMSESGNIIVEIKCPGHRDHAIALQGKIPDHYFPQLQHQMYVCDLPYAYYFSFDGFDGVIVQVYRCKEYIEKMLDEEKKFYKCLQNRTPPEPSPNEHKERTDSLWIDCVSKWKSICDEIKRLQEEEETLRKQLIFLSGESNTRGGGISLSQVKRKGSVDYSKVPELKGVNLDQYRKKETMSWRITCE